MAPSPTRTNPPGIENTQDDDSPIQGGPDRPRPVFVFDVDDTTYEHDRPTITGAEIMAVAGINPSDGLIQILPDGTRETVDPDDRVQLVPGIQFKRRPRFKRG
jgi:hypothetical protein